MAIRTNGAIFTVGGNEAQGGIVNVNYVDPSQGPANMMRANAPKKINPQTGNFALDPNFPPPRLGSLGSLRGDTPPVHHYFDLNGNYLNLDPDVEYEVVKTLVASGGMVFRHFLTVAGSTEIIEYP